MRTVCRQWTQQWLSLWRVAGRATKSALHLHSASLWHRIICETEEDSHVCRATARGQPRHFSSYLRKDCARTNHIKPNFTVNYYVLCTIYSLHVGNITWCNFYFKTSNIGFQKASMSCCSITSHSQHHGRSCSNKAVLILPKLIGLWLWLRRKHSKSLLALLLLYENKRVDLLENKLNNVSEDYHPANNTTEVLGLNSKSEMLNWAAPPVS